MLAVEFRYFDVQDQLHSMLLHGYWVKITDCASFLDAVGPHLELTRFMSPNALTKVRRSTTFDMCVMESLFCATDAEAVSEIIDAVESVHSGASRWSV